MDKNRKIIITIFAVVVIVIILFTYYFNIYHNPLQNRDPALSNNTVPLKVHPIVNITERNLSGKGDDIRYQSIHKAFAQNYSEKLYTIDLRDTIIKDMMKQASDKNENSINLFKAIYIFYPRWNEVTCCLPCYAEKARFNQTSIWVVVFFVSPIHFHLIYVSIPIVEKLSFNECNWTAVLYERACG